MGISHGGRGRMRWAVVGSALALGAVGWTSIAAPGAGADPGPSHLRAKDEARIELGRRLFFDPVVSRTGQRSCVACHDPERAFSDSRRFSTDDLGQTRRHAQTLLDVAENPTGHWDGEFASLEELVLARVDRVPGRNRYDPPSASPVTRPPPLPALRDVAGAGLRGGVLNPVLQSRARAFGEVPQDLNLLPGVAQTVEDAGRYGAAFEAAFDSPAVTPVRIARAIADFCRSIRSTESPLDRHLAGDPSALDPAQRRGLALFRGRAGCAQCHVLSGTHPLLTDFSFRNNGVTWRSLQATLGVPAAAFDIGRVAHVDVGRASFSTASGDDRKFKVPTLRDVARRGPYMHDGSFATLADVVRHYARGGSTDPRQDARIRAFQPDERDVDDLVAFLEALSGAERPGLATRAWRERVSRTRARFVDGRGRAMAGLEVALVPAGDVVPLASDGVVRVKRTTDDDGRIEFAPSARTHVRIVLPGDVLPLGGALVPDTCARLDVRVPVDGRVRLLVTFAAGAEAPERLVAEHENPHRLPGDPFPSTLFERIRVTPLGERQAVLYEGWRRTDVAPRITLRLPEGKAKVDLAAAKDTDATLRVEASGD